MSPHAPRPTPHTPHPMSHAPTVTPYPNSFSIYPLPLFVPPICSVFNELREKLADRVFEPMLFGTPKVRKGPCHPPANPSHPTVATPSLISDLTSQPPLTSSQLLPPPLTSSPPRLSSSRSSTALRTASHSTVQRAPSSCHQYQHRHQHRHQPLMFMLPTCMAVLTMPRRSRRRRRALVPSFRPSL